MESLTVLYDARCALCVRCRDYLLSHESYVHLELLPAGSDEAHRRYGRVPWLGAELCVVSDEGHVWVGPAAFLMCLWALCETREWSYRLSTPALAPLAERFFAVFSSNRARIAAFLKPRCDGPSCTIDHGSWDDAHRAPRGTYR